MDFQRVSDLLWPLPGTRRMASLSRLGRVVITGAGVVGCGDCLSHAESPGSLPAVLLLIGIRFALGRAKP